MLLLPQGLSNGGVVVATAVYSLACLVASRWIAGLRRVAAEAPHPAALPLLGTTAVFIAMMVMGPVDCHAAAPPPGHGPSRSPPWSRPGSACWLPVLTGFFAAQYLIRPRRRAA